MFWGVLHAHVSNYGVHWGILPALTIPHFESQYSVAFIGEGYAQRYLYALWMQLGYLVTHGIGNWDPALEFQAA